MNIHVKFNIKIVPDALYKLVLEYAKNCELQVLKANNIGAFYTFASKHTHTTVLRLYGFCPGQPG